MKYWNSRRIKRTREKQKRLVVVPSDGSLRATSAKVHQRKRVDFMLDVLGNRLHRKMLSRLRKGGAMSVSYLAEPFHIMLPDAMRHVHMLEKAGLITTEKRGRIRFCIYNSNAPKELGTWLATSHPFDLD